MRKNIMIIACVFLANSALCQNPYIDFHSALKAYDLIDYNESEKRISIDPVQHTSYSFRKREQRFLHPTIAIQWRTKKNNFHEIELSDYKYKVFNNAIEERNDSSSATVFISSARIVDVSVAMRYEYILMFNKKKEKRFVPALGFGGSPYYLFHSEGTNGNAPYMKETRVGINTFITPRLCYFFSSKLFIDINIPVCITRAELLVDNEAFSSSSNNPGTVSTFDFHAMPKYFSGRIGIGIKL